MKWGQASPPLAAIGASTIKLNVLVEASRASVIKTMRCVIDVRFICGSFTDELSRNASSVGSAV